MPDGSRGINSMGVLCDASVITAQWAFAEEKRKTKKKKKNGTANLFVGLPLIEAAFLIIGNQTFYRGKLVSDVFSP